MRSCTCEVLFSRDIPETMEMLHSEYAIDYNVFEETTFPVSRLLAQRTTLLFINHNHDGEYRFTVQKYFI